MGCRAAPGGKHNVMRLDTMIAKLVILLLLRTGFVAGQACLSGATIIVDATIERQYLVSTNWAADEVSNVIGDNEFVGGGFLNSATQGIADVPLAPSAECKFVITAPAGYHVKTAILAMGLQEQRGGFCLYYIEMEDTNAGFPGPGDGRFCSSPTGGFRPDNAATLQYTEATGQYVRFLPPPYSTTEEFPNQAVLQCSQNRTLSVDYSNQFIQDNKYIGFVMSFR